MGSRRTGTRPLHVELGFSAPALPRAGQREIAPPRAQAPFDFLQGCVLDGKTLTLAGDGQRLAEFEPAEGGRQQTALA